MEKRKRGWEHVGGAEMGRGHGRADGGEPRGTRAPDDPSVRSAGSVHPIICSRRQRLELRTHQHQPYPSSSSPHLISAAQLLLIGSPPCMDLRRKEARATGRAAARRPARAEGRAARARTCEWRPGRRVVSRGGRSRKRRV